MGLSIISDEVVIGSELPAGDNLIGKVGIDQVTANANEVVVKSGTVTAVTAITNALPAGTNNIGDTDIAVQELVVHPFGKRALTTDGVQYCTEHNTSTDDYETVESVTINQPSGYTLNEIELSLTAAIKSSSTAESVLWKWQISDDGSTWVDLIAEQTRAADASAYADVNALGRFNPQANALLTGTSFQVKFVVKSGGAGGETAYGKTKASSYIITRYRRS